MRSTVSTDMEPKLSIVAVRYHGYRGLTLYSGLDEGTPGPDEETDVGPGGGLRGGTRDSMSGLSELLIPHPGEQMISP